MGTNDAWLPAAWRVEHVTHELPDVTTLEVMPLDGAVPAALPGQFNMLYAFGVGEAAISLSRIAADRHVHTVRAVGAISRALAALRPGARLGVRGPFGTAWPLDEAEGHDVVVVAGGLGLAPLRPAIEHLLAHRERYGRVVVLVGARGPAELLYRDELERWRALLDVQVEVTLDHADAAWHGHVGVVTELIPRADFDPARTLALVCGPEVMMRFAATALRDAGVSPARIHLSMERNMKCAVAQCGHCQFGPAFVCRDGPVMRYDRIAALLAVREI